MSFGNVEILDSEPIDTSIINGDFLKVDHHQQTSLDDPD